MADEKSTKAGKAADKPKSVSPKRQAAIDAYKAQFGRNPANKRMSIADMNRRVESKKGWKDHVQRQVSHAPAPSPAGPGWMARAKEIGANNPGSINTGLAVVGTGVAAAQGYSRARAEGKDRGEAAIEAAKNAALPAALAAAPAISRGAHAVGSGAFAVADAAMSQAGFMDAAFLNFSFLKAAGVSGALGVVAHGVGVAAKAAGKVAAPAVAGYQAFQGYKADGVRGAVKGAITAFDPTELATIAGAKQGAAGWAFDKAFGAKDGTAARANLSAPAAKQFSQAQASYGGDQTTNYGGDQTTNHVEEFSRTYTTGAKAGVTETVRNWSRS